MAAKSRAARKKNSPAGAKTPSRGRAKTSAKAKPRENAGPLKGVSTGEFHLREIEAKPGTYAVSGWCDVHLLEGDVVKLTKKFKPLAGAMVARGRGPFVVGHHDDWVATVDFPSSPSNAEPRGGAAGGYRRAYHAVGLNVIVDVPEDRRGRPHHGWTSPPSQVH